MVTFKGCSIWTKSMMRFSLYDAPFVRHIDIALFVPAPHKKLDHCNIQRLTNAAKSLIPIFGTYFGHAYITVTHLIYRRDSVIICFLLYMWYLCDVHVIPRWCTCDSRMCHLGTVMICTFVFNPNLPGPFWGCFCVNLESITFLKVRKIMYLDKAYIIVKRNV